MSQYTPQNASKYAQAAKLFANADTGSDVKTVMIMLTFDMSYPRADIAMAHKLRCNELDIDANTHEPRGGRP